jgi:HTH-type transcriptional regulator, transcriptional repressor of NAD biosynthesis genes
MFSHGLVIGKFYPPHRGHKYLIDKARSECKKVTVILCYKPTETISGYLRAQWIQRIHPDVQVMLIEDTKLADDDSAGWAKFTLGVLGHAPDAVFTSEAYGDPYASFMGCVHVLVDRDRTHVPISATMVRSDPMRYAEFLEPCVRAYFARRIIVIGAESTGTTTLSMALAKHYQTVWVPEEGRMYSQGKIHGDKNTIWREDEFMHIAEAQNELEERLAEASNGLVICDTDSFATSVWYERYMGKRSTKVEEIANRKPHDWYIVTGDEIPFEDDGLRDGEQIRQWMHVRFIERLSEAGKKFIVVRGTHEERLEKAISAIEDWYKTTTYLYQDNALVPGL